MRIALVTDAWTPQINGVVTTLVNLVVALERRGHRVLVVHPGEFRTVPLPGYPEIRLAVFPGRGLARRLDAFRPEAVHVATEGPLGLAARRWCLAGGLPFTTAYHTRFPEYLRLRLPVPVAWTYRLLRWFHRPASRTMVPTPSAARELGARGFRNVVTWTRGVDTRLFRPRDKEFLGLPRPVSMYLGRVSVEKNLDAFLSLDLPGTRVVVGDGPDMERLRQRYPRVHFTGYQQGEALARYLAAADVLVFPSRTDTYGLVMLEAMACGVPVAAFPVPGPADVVRDGDTGALREDLGEAVLAALAMDPARCIAWARHHTWDACARQFLRYLDPATGTLNVEQDTSRVTP